MKKSILIIGLNFILAVPIYAQTNLKIGLNAGGVLSTLVRDNNLNAKGGFVGYMAGVTARLNIGELGWFVQSGIDYSHEGDAGQKLDFIKLPVTLGFDVSDDVALYGSYYIAWQIGNNNNVQDFYKKNANMIAFGVDVNLSERFGLGTRLYYGLSNLVDDPVGALYYTVKPFGFDLYLTYFLVK